MKNTCNMVDFDYIARPANEMVAEVVELNEEEMAGRWDAVKNVIK